MNKDMNECNSLRKDCPNMMTLTENLLITASEECAEIQHAISKALRFGLQHKHPTRTTTNLEDILTEYYHLTAVIELMQEEYILPENTFGKTAIALIKRDKKNAVKHYLDISSQLGCIEKFNV